MRIITIHSKVPSNAELDLQLFYAIHAILKRPFDIDIALLASADDAQPNSFWYEIHPLGDQSAQINPETETEEGKRVLDSVRSVTSTLDFNEIQPALSQEMYTGHNWVAVTEERQHVAFAKNESISC